MARETDPYSKLARGYDAIMAHVDYPGWVDYVDQLLRLHGGPPRSVLELGCGTGTFALLFEALHPVLYEATDFSNEMLEVAFHKALGAKSSVRFEKRNFLFLEPSARFDTALMLYDGLNYLTDPADVARLFDRVSGALLPGGRFLFDQATPANSMRHSSLFEDAGRCEAFSYVRKSRYDRTTGLHETVFELETEKGPFVERHIQRPYRFSEIRDILTASPLEPVASYADFLLRQADSTAERVHWIARKPF